MILVTSLRAFEVIGTIDDCVSTAYDETIESKHLCHKCIDDKFLKEKMRKSGKSRKCAFCKKTLKGYRLAEIALEVETAFETFYIRTSDLSMQTSLPND